MKNLILVLFSLIFFSSNISATGFEVNAKGIQTFNFEDRRNQAHFYSKTPLEDIHGLSSGISGTATFDIEDVKNTLKGQIIVDVASIKTGIDMRDEHLRADNWLNAEKYPNIIFTIRNVKDLNKESNNKLNGSIVGEFELLGVKKEVTAEFSMIYLDESEQTKMRAPGDLLSVNAKFNIKLSDFGVKNDLIGNKVAENIEITVSIVGSNAK